MKLGPTMFQRRWSWFLIRWFVLVISCWFGISAAGINTQVISKGTPGMTGKWVKPFLTLRTALISASAAGYWMDGKCRCQREASAITAEKGTEKETWLLGDKHQQKQKPVGCGLEAASRPAESSPLTLPFSRGLKNLNFASEAQRKFLEFVGGKCG